ncbi:lipopolysaccharide assembly protein LapA domain-containing protein [Jiangella muralis]|uniref:lipopolysaccharide assembly protein LapA domain-containing protein n=1 Tax=Jiangella muralis TaxID=702383 RepID=UPI0006A0016B|nr:lipopolysaccharide assembly protein LapA domain-containing protein [Jiangella muralis]
MTTPDDDRPAGTAPPADGEPPNGGAANGGEPPNGEPPSGDVPNGETPNGETRTREGRHGKRTGELPHSRTGAVWVGICVTVLMLGLLIVFIAQNTETVDVTFLWMDGTVPLSVALLIAAAGAGLLATIVGTIRIAQLRRLNRRS